MKKSLKVLLNLITNKEKTLPDREEVFTHRKLNTFIGRKLIITPLIAKGNIIKMDKLANVMEVVISLDKLDNTDNLEDGKLSNVLLGYQVTGSVESMDFELVAPQYKRLKNGEFASLTLSIMDQKGNGITDGLGMTIVFHITKIEYGKKLNPEHSLRTTRGIKGTR